MKINVNATEKLAQAIVEAEGKATVRTITAQAIQEWVKVVERKLEERGISKQSSIGMRFLVNLNAQSFPNAYRYNPEATLYEIQRFASGWFVTAIRRGFCSNYRITLLTKLTDEQTADVLTHAKRF
jgi:hypothetical protein